MEKIRTENLTFRYPGRSENALSDINIIVEEGEYVVLTGRSGCGKTTLLRALKPVTAPNGEKNGKIFISSRDINSLSQREQVSRIGFVSQNPDSQIVTDKVWHELAFGLESLGLDGDEIRRRTAEMSEYFGISDWFRRDTSSLSGGQKQLLNLASVMVMQPEILLLDEPVSQLDPIAAASFLESVAKINRELGVTVVISEHRLEEVMKDADRAAVMDNGRIIAYAPPREICSEISSLPDFMKYACPAPARIFASLGFSGEKCPLTVREGRHLLCETVKNPKCTFIEREKQEKSEIILNIKNVCFRYEKNSAQVLDDINIKFQKGKITAILGGNGSGKTTLLKIIAGLLKPLSGKVKSDGRKIAYLPQSVTAVFTEKTVREDLEIISNDIESIVKLADISSVLDCHPFDISGGEQQRAALAKLLLTNPDIILLDEPTKGMDGEYKERFAEILKKLASSGKTVILVSHDTEFCASHTDVCMLLFDGSIVSENESRDFFAGNSYYTTSSHRMSCGIFENAVTAEEVVSLCKKNQAARNI